MAKEKLHTRVYHQNTVKRKAQMDLDKIDEDENSLFKVDFSQGLIDVAGGNNDHLLS